MPVWGLKPETELDNALQTVLEGLEEEVADNPTFDTVTGIPLDLMIPHATQAISQVFGKNRSDLEDLIQCYAMGFVIGMKFAHYRKEQSGGDG